MKRSKKYLSALVVLAMSGMSLAACSKPNEEAPNTDKPVELVVWESTLGPDDWIKQAGDAFTAKNPNITIKYVNVEFGDSTSQIALDGPAGVGADLFAAPHDKLGELVSGGHVLPTANAATVKSAVLGATSTALTFDNVMYGYPTSAETYGMYYNKDLITEAELPKTWDDLIAWGTKFNDANPTKHAFVMDVTSMYYSIVFTTMNGNRLFGKSGTDISSSYLNTDDAVAGMKVFQKLRTIINVPSADLTTSIADGAFESGTAALHISGPWNIAKFVDAGLNYGVAPLPAFAGENQPSSSFSGTRGMFVSAYSNHPEEAALFGEFLISEEMQNLRYEITGALPSIDIAVDSEYAKGFISQLDYAFPMPSIPQMSAFWASAGSASCNIWDGADVKTELDSLNQALVSFTE